MYRRHEPKVLAYTLRRAPPEVAKDAVAETFLAAWRRFDELSEDPLPWLIGAARKTLANQRRSARRQTRLSGRLAALPLEPAVSPHPFDPSIAARGALERLRPKDREVLLLIGWDGLTPAEAAKSLGISAAGFRVRLHRARRRFECFLDAEEGATMVVDVPAARKVASRL
jgi:RNA polymerase sigma-70 factor (ECF subfamily)